MKQIMKRILKFLGYVLVAMAIAMGASVLLSSCDEFEGALTRDCKCTIYLDSGERYEDIYFNKKDRGHRKIEGCDWVDKESPLGPGTYICVAENETE